MSEHVLNWIAAYHDGELNAARRSQVETHLLECPACRAELETLHALSTMLQMNPAMPVRTPPERFVAQVPLRTRSHPASPALRRMPPVGGLVVPLSVLGIWAFLQAVLALSQLVLVALPLVGGGPGTLSEWFPGQLALQFFVLELALTAVLAALLWGWLAGWWASRLKQTLSSGESAG
jgi:anti-sigma factor RsiW